MYTTNNILLTNQDGFGAKGFKKTFNNPADWKQHIQDAKRWRKNAFLVNPV